jgi:class 3 adenylate cyclase/pimeloyl-ACP methyl ester carboxylesterase
MDAPPIQYAKTSDGVSIAYWAMGEGAPLLLTPPLSFSHLTLEWGFAPLRDWYLHLIGSRTLVRWDRRCNGLSERNVQDVGQTADVRDMEAVVERLGMPELDIVATGGECIPALEFAARHPERVRRLILINPVARGDSFGRREHAPALLSLLDQDYDLFCETYAHSVLGWSTGAVAHAFARFMAASASQEDLARALVISRTYDAGPYLGQVAAGTLVIYQPRSLGGLRYSESAREIASRISNAQLIEVSLEQSMYFDTRRVREAIDDFLGIEATPAQPEKALPSGTAVILFADIADSTALTERMGDAAFREKARELDTALRSAITSNGGTAIEGKLLGDGVLATFGAAREAIACAAACHQAGSHAGLPLHVGIHAGDVIREEGNIFGGAVNISSRVAGEAAAGETLVSATVRELARTSAGVEFEDRGERALKGVGEPVRVWAVVEQGTGNKEPG